MSSAQEMVSGDRWLSVPGTNFDSAFYALAAGLATKPGIQRPLDWSTDDPTEERKNYDKLVDVWMHKPTPPHKHPSLEHEDTIFDFELFRPLVQVWNLVSTPAQRRELSQDKGDSIETLQHYAFQMNLPHVLVRRVGDRWEAFGHYEDDKPSKGRYISTPGTNFESAAYALAIGLAADPHNTQPLDWSGPSAEKMVYDSLMTICMQQTLAYLTAEEKVFDPRNAVTSGVLARVISSWNVNMPNLKIRAFMIDVDGLIRFTGDKGWKSVSIILRSSRWEGYGYFQDPAAVSNHVQAPISPSSVIQVNPEPVAKLYRLGDPDYPSESASGAGSEDHEPTESMNSDFCKISESVFDLSRLLNVWTEK